MWMVSSGAAGVDVDGRGAQATAGRGVAPVRSRVRASLPATESGEVACGAGGFFMRTAGAMTMRVMSAIAQIKRRSMVRSPDQGTGSYPPGLNG